MALTQELLAARQKKLTDSLSQNGLDAAAIVPGANLYFLTGVQLHLMERPTVLIIFADGSMRAVIPELERMKWSAAMPGADTVYWQDSDGFDEAFRRAGLGAGRIRIGVEGQRMRVFEYQALTRGFTGADLRDAEAEIAHMRLCKDGLEISLMKQAIDISEKSLAAVIERLRPGMSERFIQAMLKSEMLDQGAEGFAFEPIVLAGPNSANPHGHPSESNKLEPGQALLFDFGASCGGYHADITRTFFCGSASSKHRDLYETVRQANALGRELAAPGITADSVDIQVTGSMRSSRFSEFIVHRTGHGLGLYVHEEPQVMAGNSYRLEEGAVITIEPGLYIPDEIGVRIEDDVVITRDGSLSLTEFPRELTVI